MDFINCSDRKVMLICMEDSDEGIFFDIVDFTVVKSGAHVGSIFACCENDCNEEMLESLEFFREDQRISPFTGLPGKPCEDLS